MPPRKGRRKWVIGLVLCLVAGLLLVLSLPIWFPWVLRPLGASQGLHYAGYDRASGGRFILHDAVFTNRTLRISAHRLEAYSPGVWLWRSLSGDRMPQQPYASVQNWELEIVPSPEPSEGTGSVSTAAKDVQEVAKALRRWLPFAALTNGSIHFDSNVLRLPEAVWARGWLNTDVYLAKPQARVSVAADFSHRAPYQVQLKAPDLETAASLDVTPATGNLSATGTLVWLTNQIALTTRFGPKGTLPEVATLSAPELRVPAKLLKLPGYNDLTGAASLRWRNGRYEIDVNGAGTPLDVETNLRPVQFVLRGGGDTNVARIDFLHVSAPGVWLDLSQPLEVQYRQPFLRAPAQVSLGADLAQQTWLTMEGQLAARALLTPGDGPYPAISFQVSGSKVRWPNLPPADLSLAGSLEWPRLILTNSQIRAVDGTVIDLAGGLDLVSNVLEPSEISASAPNLERWLPEAWQVEHVEFHGRIEGPFSNLVHSAKLSANRVVLPQVRPLKLEADWSGHQLDFSRARIELKSDATALRLQSAFRLTPGSAALRLEELSLLTNGAPQLRLAQPCEIAFSRASTNWALTTTPLRLTGGSRLLEITATATWPERGNLKLSARELSTSMVSEFLSTQLPELEVRLLNASAHWTNGPATWAASLSAQGRLPLKEPASTISPAVGAWLKLPFVAEFQAEGAQQGLTISNLVINSQTSTVATARGFLPLTLHPGGPRLAEFSEEKPARFELATQPSSPVWAELERLTGLGLQDPRIQILIEGTVKSPKGRVQLDIQQVRFPQHTNPVPSFENTQLRFTFDQQSAQLEDGRFLVQGQPVLLTAGIPLGERFWRALLRPEPTASTNRSRAQAALQWLDWQQTTAHLQIDGAALDAFAPLFPTLLSPQGELEADVRLLAGANLEGGIQLRRARTRPLPTVGPIRDINAELQFHGRTLDLTQVSAQVGGATVVVAGQADLRGWQWLTNSTLPPFEITIRGTNVPLARQPDTIIRSDLALAVTKTNLAAPLISGQARLTESYFLSDLADLVPGKVASPERRPPYFSITTPELAEWRLGVKVTGERFLRVRSPLFQGQISANLRLEGTLREPLALGDLTVASGLVKFPFASFAVQQGFVTLTSQDPYRPRLQLTAGSKRAGYELHMEVTGPVDAPVIQFSSTPPLSSEQILLMATAGEMPQSTHALTTQQRAQTLGVFLGSGLLAKLGFGDTSEERLTFQSGQELTEQGKPTYSVEYKVTDRWSIVGEYDRFGAYNAGLKWRVYSK